MYYNRATSRLAKRYIVHELKLGDMAELVGSLGCLKGHDTWKIVDFLIFSNICCRFTLELPLGGNSKVYLQHMYFQ